MGIRTSEYYNGFDGSYGGLWRRNARPPQQLVGIGFTAQGVFTGGGINAFVLIPLWIGFTKINDDVIGDFALVATAQPVSSLIVSTLRSITD